jgi:hypothetical protein
MPIQYAGATRYPQYTIDGCGHIATHFDSLEKAAKITYRVIDIALLLMHDLSQSFSLLSTQIKELVLVIESTRFFPVSYPLFFADEKGKRFHQNKTGIQTIEKVSLSAHLVFKIGFVLEKVELIALGVISSYKIGYLTLYRWLAEGCILSYNFFGTIDGILSLNATERHLSRCQEKIDKWKSREHISNYDVDRVVDKLRKWESAKDALYIERNKAWLKIAATISKFILITTAVGLIAINHVSFAGQMMILSLGIISDLIGLTRIFYNEYGVK